jgi:hypothetical protein
MESSITKYQKFNIQTIERGEIKNAPYNPRSITDDARRRLKLALQNVGLVQPIVWNKRTGHIVGGHQRIKALDSLEGKAEYQMSVAVVDVALEREKELNILLNASSVQGDFDWEKVKELLEEDAIILENAGFNSVDMLKLFGDDSAEKGKMLEDCSKNLEDVKGAYARMCDLSKAKDDLRFYSIVIFRNSNERELLNEKLGVADDERYVKGDILLEVLGVPKESYGEPPISPVAPNKPSPLQK